MTLKPGDKVFFNTDLREVRQYYTVKSEEYTLEGVKVVDLEGYPGEVGVHYLEKI